MTLSAGCLFSGMGGFASGLVAAGFEIRWANDNDRHACAAFRQRFPDVHLYEQDVHTLHGDELSPVDVMAAGFPCQSFSQAGDRRGFDDPRGMLFFEIPRLVQELSAPPRFLILENVPHLLYGADGAWFNEVRREVRRSGYWFRESACWTVNVKDATDLPQDRERLIMVAASRDHFSYNPFEPPEPVGTLRALEDIVDRSSRGAPESYLRPDNRYYQMIENEMLKGESKLNVYQLRRSYVREKKNGLCPTLTANMGIGGSQCSVRPR